MLKSFAFAAAILAIYLGLLTKTHYWDGVLFSLYIEKVAAGEMAKEALFHPNHLLYSAAGFVVYDIFSPLRLRAMTCLQVFNAVCGTAAAALIYRMSISMTRSRYVGVFCAVLFAFGATWWKFSTDAGSYVPAVFLMLLALRAALAGRTLETIAYHVPAMLLHELAVFACLPFAFALAVRAGRQRAVIYVTAAGVLTLAVYSLAFHVSGADRGSYFLSWITSFSGESKMTHSLQQIFVIYPISWVKLFFGGKVSLVREFVSLPVIASLAGAGILLAASIIFLRKPGSDFNPWQNDRYVEQTLWLSIAPYAFFLVWWEPGNAFYKLFCWPAIVLLLGIAVTKREWWRRRRKAVLAFALSMAAFNLGAFIYPHTRVAADPVYQLALKLDEELPRDAKVMYRVFSPDDWYLAYFAPGRDWRAAPGGNLEEDAPLCLETTALGSADVNTGGLRETRRWELKDGKHDVRVACFARR